jgi:8-oxo-dGTP diphosphatase
VIRAAGGLVVRDGLVLLVHRPKYDDWSFPKGKLRKGESWKAAALREVEEETSLVCEPGPEAGRTHYEVEGQPKEVRYYRLRCATDAHAANEVDEVRWVDPSEARTLLSYDHDRELLDSSFR